MNPSRPIPVFLSMAAAIGGVLLAGCGGSIGSGLSHAAPAAPLAMSLQPGALALESPESVPLAVATKGQVVWGSKSQSGESTLLVGSSQFRPGVGRSDAVVSGLNQDLALLQVDGESLLWPYRRPVAPFKAGSGHLAAIASDANVILEELRSSSNRVVGLNMLSFTGNSAVHLPYRLGDILGSGRHVRSVGIDGQGNALIEVSSSTAGEIATRLPSGTFDHRLKSLARYVDRLVEGHSAPAWYLLAKGRLPVQLQCPSKSLGIFVSAMRSPGRAVGAVVIGKGTAARSIPCWWDMRGQLHELPLPNDVNFGIAADANPSGAVVGVVGNEITSYGALWPTVQSEAKNVNGMLPTDSDYELRWIDSVGIDFSMVALAQSKLNPDQSVLVGLSPR